MTAPKLILIFFSLLLVGCGQQYTKSSKSKTQSGSKTCTMLAAASLAVDVATADPSNISVRVSVNGVLRGTYQWTSGSNQSQEYEDGTSLTWNGNKLTWGYYYETPGKFSVTVTDASGGQQTKTATIVTDGCHVIQQTLNFSI